MKFLRLQPHNLCIGSPAVQWNLWKTVWPNQKWENPKWRPLNFKCMYLRFQTKSKRNFNGFTYVIGGPVIQRGLMGTMYNQSESGLSKMTASIFQMQRAPLLSQKYDYLMAATITPLFWELVEILCDQTGGRKNPKMATSELQTRTYLACWSKL